MSIEVYQAQITSDFANLRIIGHSLYSLHWNLVSPHFLAIHKWSDKAHSQSLELVDSLAERLRGLNIIIPTSLDDLFTKKTIGELVFPCTDLQALTQLLADVTVARQQVVNSQNYLSQDLGTQDILISTEQFYSKLIWFIQAQGVALPQVSE